MPRAVLTPLRVGCCCLCAINRSKWFLDKLGHEGLNQMLAGFEDKSVRSLFLCIAKWEPCADHNDVDDLVSYLGLRAVHLLLLRWPRPRAYCVRRQDRSTISAFFGRLQRRLTWSSSCSFKGKIVPARGPTNFGWDPIFLPDGFDQTYALL